MTLNKRLPHTDILLDIYTRRGYPENKNLLNEITSRDEDWGQFIIMTDVPFDDALKQKPKKTIQRSYPNNPLEKTTKETTKKIYYFDNKIMIGLSLLIVFPAIMISHQCYKGNSKENLK